MEFQSLPLCILMQQVVSLGITLKYFAPSWQKSNGEERRVMRVAANLCCPVYFWFALQTFALSKERSNECRSAHSNLTVVAAQRRTGFVLV